MDIIKHLSIFDPNRVQGRVAVVGLGALGCGVALHLAKLGLNLSLFDDDQVEDHNVANQYLYGPGDVGFYKTEAARDRIGSLTGHYPRIEFVRVTTKNQLRGFHSIFVCVDSMDQRSNLLKLAFGSGAQFLVEGRMGASNGAAYLIRLNDSLHLSEYKKELYPDSDVIEDRAVCGTVLSVGPTASMVASHMAWLFIENVMSSPESPYIQNEVIFSLRPMSLTSRRFKTSE